MEPLPLISIIVSTRNRAALLGECLESLSSQTYPGERLELVIVDDGSEDHTPDVVKNFQVQHSHMTTRYVWQDHSGLNAGRNTGILASRGAAVGLIDDDEMAPPFLLETLVNALFSNPEATAVGGSYRTKLVGSVPFFVCKSCRKTFKSSEYPSQDAETTSVDDLLGGCLLARREAFNQYGLFDETLSSPGDDSEWCARVRCLGGRLLFVRKAWVWHRLDATDLQISTLQRRCISGMKNLARARQLMRWPRPWTDDVRQAARFLGHGLFRGCRVGMIQGLGRLLLAFYCARQSGCTNETSGAATR